MGFLLIEYTQDHSFSKLFSEKGEKALPLSTDEQSFSYSEITNTHSLNWYLTQRLNGCSSH